MVGRGEGQTGSGREGGRTLIKWPTYIRTYNKNVKIIKSNINQAVNHVWSEISLVNVIYVSPMGMHSNVSIGWSGRRWQGAAYLSWRTALGWFGRILDMASNPRYRTGGGGGDECSRVVE